MEQSQAATAILLVKYLEMHAARAGAAKALAESGHLAKACRSPPVQLADSCHTHLARSSIIRLKPVIHDGRSTLFPTDCR